MASREETKKMRSIVSEYGLRDYNLDPAGDPVVYSRRRTGEKDQLFLYNASGSSNLAAFIYGSSPRKLGSKLKKLVEIGCSVLQQSTSEATVRFPNNKIKEVSKLLKCDKIIRSTSKKQLETLKRIAKSRQGKGQKE